MSVFVSLSLILSGLPLLQFSPNASALTSTAPNLIVNPGFENRLNGWSASEGTAAYVTDLTTRHSGCCSAEGIEIGQETLGRLYQDVTGVTSPGNHYQISGWIKTDHATRGAVIGLDYVGADGRTPPDGHVMEIGKVTGTQDWTFFQSSPFILPKMPSDTQALWFLFDFNMGTGTAWFDDVSLVQVATLPNYFVTVVPITVTNGQTSPTAAPFQQMVQVDSSLFSSYESPNLQNVEFFDANGTVIPSWLESGNSNTATNTIYWLKLADGIPADSSLTIYMGFATLGTNLFNGNTIGEAPQLSAVYGQFDDGGNVFPFYDNFTGGNLSSSWTTNLPESQTGGNGSYTMKDGLTLGSYPTTQGYVATVRTYSTGSAFDSYVTADGGFDSIGFFNLGVPTDGLTFTGAFIRAFGSYTYPDQWDFSGHGEANYRTARAVFDEQPPYGYFVHSLRASGVYSVNLLYDQGSTQYLNYSEGNSVQPMFAHPPGYPLSAGFVAGKSSIRVEWARVRAVPPGGIMPVASLLASTLSSSEAVAGGSVTDSSTLTGVTSDAGGTVSYDYFSGNTCSGPPTEVGPPVNVTAGIVPPSPSQTFNVAGSYSWRSTYSGDQYNKGFSSGCEVLSVYDGPLLTLALSCKPASVVVGSTTTCKARVQGTGTTPVGTIAWSSDGQGRFIKPSCKLSKGACSVRFTTASAGPSSTIIASYQRTPSEPPFTGTSALTVTAKASQTSVSCTSATTSVVSMKSVICNAKVTGYSPRGTVRWSLSGTGSISINSTSCSLNSLKNPNQAACSVTIVGASAGQVILRAAYIGDPDDQGSSGTAKLTVKA